MTHSTRIDFIYLSEAGMIKAGVTDMPACVAAMGETFALMHKRDFGMAGSENNSHGAMLMFPKQPEHKNMPASDPDRRLMAMPAYLTACCKSPAMGSSCKVMWRKTMRGEIDAQAAMFS